MNAASDPLKKKKKHIKVEKVKLEEPTWRWLGWRCAG